MSTGLMIFGGICVLLCLASLAFYAFGYAADMLRMLCWSVQDQAKINALKELGYRLKSQACWFSESEEASAALKYLGIQLGDRGNFDVSDVRDEWRNRDKAETFTPQS